jgi:hypothetical protein
VQPRRSLRAGDEAEIGRSQNTVGRPLAPKPMLGPKRMMRVARGAGARLFNFIIRRFNVSDLLRRGSTVAICHVDRRDKSR